MSLLKINLNQIKWASITNVFIFDSKSLNLLSCFGINNFWQSIFATFSSQQVTNIRFQTPEPISEQTSIVLCSHIIAKSGIFLRKKLLRLFFFANFLYLISLSQNGISSLSLISLVPLVPKKGGRKHLIPDSRLRANTLCIVLPSKWKMNKILATKKPKGLFSHNPDSECKWHIGQ